MVLVHERLKAKKVERLKIFAKKCKIENSGKKTFDKNLKWELEDVERFRRLSCLQVQAEIKEENILLKKK